MVHSAERSQYYVRPEMSHEEIAFWQKSPTNTCPIVWTHPSGRKSLLLGATADYVKGLPVEESQSCPLACATGRPSPKTCTSISGNSATPLSGTTPELCTECSHMRLQRPSHAPHHPRGGRGPR